MSNSTVTATSLATPPEPVCLQPGAVPEMADASKNGSAKKARPSKSTNTLSSMRPPTVNGGPIKVSRTPSAKSAGFMSRLVGASMRLLAWYAIATVLFRCPASFDQCTDTTPSVCVGYFQLKNIVAPHVQPYYDTYAAPYVQNIKPYYDAADRAALKPAWGYAQKYGAPALDKAQAVGKAQWEKNVQPKLAHYQALAQSKYDEVLAPHVNQALKNLGPYYEIARTNALQTYHDVLLPSYSFARPYVVQSYNAVSDFATRTAVPAASWAWNKTYAFLDSTVWPQLRLLYMEAVEPQLLKIGRRLGRYNGAGAAPKAGEALHKTIASKATSSFTRPTMSTSSTYSAPAIVSSASSLVSSAASVISETVSSLAHPSATPFHRFSETAEQVEAPEPDDDEEEKRRIARETVAEDLKAWQEKYTKAADEGAAEIQERVDEIAKQMLSREVRARGQGLLQSLQDTIVAELVSLRRKIPEVVGAVQKGQATAEEGEEQILGSIRAAGLQIKKKAKDVRSWHEAFDMDVRTQVTAAADSHFEILGSIKDLALQKIGMKWAWTDGITYKDWAKYHLLRSRFQEWEQDMEKLVVSHPGLIECQNEGQAIEDRAMDLATSAAKELGRLKQVALWKLAALDDSSDFDSETAKAAYDASQRVKTDGAASAEKVEAVADADAAENPEKVLEREAATSVATTPASESDSQDSPAADEVSIGSSALKESVSSLSSAFSTASESASSSADSYFSTGTASPVAEPEPLASVEAVSILAEAVANASETTAADTPVEAGAEAEPIELPVSTFDEKPGEPSVAPAETPKDAETPADGGDEKATGNLFVEAADEAADQESVSPPRTEKIATVKPALFGAAAEAVPSRKPILDDDTIESLKKQGGDIPATLSSVASSAYSVALSRASVQYESARKIISDSMPKGTAQPVHASLLSSVSDAYAKAVASASGHLHEAIQSAESLYGAAANKVVPTPTPTPFLDWAAVESIAAERLSQGRSWAEEQYSSAKVAIGVATPTPDSAAERLMQNAQYKYYAGLGVAQARYTEFLAAASSALSSLTATPTPTDLQGTISSVASVASQSAVSAANAAGENAAAAYSAASESASSVASVVGDNASAAYEAAGSALDAAGSAVSSNWEAVVSDLSSRVYGAPTPTPWYEGMYSAAGEYAAAATDALLPGHTETAKNAAAKATDAAAKQYLVVSSIVSELVVGREPSFSESVFSRLEEAYKIASATAASIAGEATEAAKSATEAAKEKIEHVKDEL